MLVGSIDEPVDPGRVLPIVAEGRVDGINSAHDLDGFFAEDSGEHENFRGSWFGSRYSASVSTRTNHTTVTIGTIWFDGRWTMDDGTKGNIPKLGTIGFIERTGV
ncbi:MAG: hypothetical protein VYA62_11160, partial [Planctomycetota bacterium]|nr:hypothetical protein [Planctomycetota bacterium]